MLLQSRPGLKSEIQKVSSAPSWSLTFFVGDNCSKAWTPALICRMKPPVALQKTAEFLYVLCLHGTGQ